MRFEISEIIQVWVNYFKSFSGVVPHGFQEKNRKGIG